MVGAYKRIAFVIYVRLVPYIALCTGAVRQGITPAWVASLEALSNSQTSLTTLQIRQSEGWAIVIGLPAAPIVVTKNLCIVWYPGRPGTARTATLLDSYTINLQIKERPHWRIRINFWLRLLWRWRW
jgi:hypothetical protein